MSHTFSLVGKQLAFTHSRKIPLLLNNNECKHAPRLSQDVAPLHLSFLKFHLHFFQFSHSCLINFTSLISNFSTKNMLAPHHFCCSFFSRVNLCGLFTHSACLQRQLDCCIHFFCNSLDARWA